MALSSWPRTLGALSDLVVVSCYLVHRFAWSDADALSRFPGHPMLGVAVVTTLAWRFVRARLQPARNDVALMRTLERLDEEPSP